MRLLVSLVLVLIGVIVLSYYKNKEYFANPTLIQGSTVQCINAPNGGAPGLYQYSGGMMNYYPSPQIAATWDCNAATPTVMQDCSAFALGKPMQTNTNNIQCAPPAVTTPPPLTTPPPPAVTAPPPPAVTAPVPAPYDPLTDILSTLNKKSTPVSNAPVSTAPVKNVLAAAATPSRHDIMPKVSVSDMGYTAMDLQNKSSFLKDIQQIVKQEIIASRTQSANHPIALGSSTNESCSTSDAMNQGNEYNTNKEDMSQYIKKNAIPCWGCSLDY